MKKDETMQTVVPFSWRIVHYIQPDLGYERTFADTYTVLYDFIFMELGNGFSEQNQLEACSD